MFWIVVLVTLTFGQVSAGLVIPEAQSTKEVFNEDVITNVTGVSSRIVSGWEAYPGQFPHVTALRSINLGGDVRNCAGSVVHRTWVLTAAVCTAGRVAVVVRAGIIDLTATPEYIFETREWWVYPTFNINRPNDVQPNDLSVLKLQHPLVYSTLVQPIRIQPSAEAFRDYSNEVVIASGWGMLWTTGSYPDVLNWVYLRAVSNLDCRRVYGTATITENHICASWHSVTSQSTCTGDNGGSLVHISRDGEPVLVGLATFWNSAGCHYGYPAGFTRTGPFQGWLTDVTGLDFENLKEEDEVTVTPDPPTTEELSTTEAPDPTTMTTEVTTPQFTTPTTVLPWTSTRQPTTLYSETTPSPSVPETITPTTEFLPWTSTVEPTVMTTEAPETTTMPTVLPWTITTEPTLADTETAMTEPELTWSPSTNTEPITTTEVPRPLPTEAPKPDSEESDDNSNDLDGSESNEDPELSELFNKLLVKVKVKVTNNLEGSDFKEDSDISQLLNKLQVKVKVKVKVNNNVKKKVKVE